MTMRWGRSFRSSLLSMDSASHLPESPCGGQCCIDRDERMRSQPESPSSGGDGVDRPQKEQRRILENVNGCLVIRPDSPFTVLGVIPERLGPMVDELLASVVVDAEVELIAQMHGELSAIQYKGDPTEVWAGFDATQGSEIVEDLVELFIARSGHCTGPWVRCAAPIIVSSRVTVASATTHQIICAGRATPTDCVRRTGALGIVGQYTRGRPSRAG